MDNICKIKIGIGGVIIDLETQYRLYLQDSDALFMPNIADYYTESYPESNGEFIYPVTKLEAEDYTVKMVYVGDQASISKDINSFLQLFFDDFDNIKKAKEVVIINEYKGVNFPAYFKSISAGDKFIRSQNGIANFTITFRITKPDSIGYNT